MRFVCLLSLIAAVALGTLLFGYGADSRPIAHAAFIVLVAIFVSSAIVLIRRVVASQVRMHTDAEPLRMCEDDEVSPHRRSRSQSGDRGSRTTD
jgi:hypothetical protein